MASSRSCDGCFSGRTGVGPDNPWQAIGASLLLLLSLSACKDKPKPAEPTPALKVVLVQPTLTRVADQVRANGLIWPREEILLGVELNGVRVSRVLVDIGESVRANQVLAELDARNLRVELAQVQAAFKQANAQLTVATADAKRGAELRKRGLVSQRDSDQTEAALINARAALEVAQANVDAANLRLSFATLRAPHDGIISAREVQPGSIATATQPFFKLIKNGELEWRAELAESEFVRLKVGMTASLSQSGKTVVGTVRALSAGLDAQTRTGLVYVTLAAAAGLKTGTFATGQVIFGAREAALLPATSIVQRDGFNYVFVVDQNLTKQIKVELGETVGTDLELRAPADLKNIVQAGAGFLSDGDRVQVVQAQTVRGDTP
jgi:RND family efflux transporter MFP subunit